MTNDNGVFKKKITKQIRLDNGNIKTIIENYNDKNELL